MRVLMIGSDTSIFEAGSPTRLRMRAYAEAFGELHAVSAVPRRMPPVFDGPLSVYPVAAPRLLRVGALSRAARAVIRERTIEIVSAQDPFEFGRAAANAVRGTNAKLHIQVHTDFLSPWFARESLKNRIRIMLADGVLRQADGIRVVSERVKRSLIARYGESIPEPSVIPIAVDAGTPAPEALPEHSFAFSLMCVGRLEREKRVADILRALAYVVKERPKESVGLFVVGDGRERSRLERLTRSLELSLRVIFLGNRPDARALMMSVQGFIQASAYEGYGRTLLEAALAQVPIITTDVGIVGEVLKNREEALVVPVGEPRLLAQEITRLMDDTQLRLELPVHAEAAARVHLASERDTIAGIRDDLARTLTRSRAHGS